MNGRKLRGINTILAFSGGTYLVSCVVVAMRPEPEGAMVFSVVVLIASLAVFLLSLGSSIVMGSSSPPRD